MIRKITGTGAGKGPVISFHDGMEGADQWGGFLAGADRVALDFHPYFAFANVGAGPLTAYVPKPCKDFGPQSAEGMRTFGLTGAGEWSNGFNDCGLYLNRVGAGSRYEGTYESEPGPRYGSCEEWANYDEWTQATKDSLRSFMLAHMDALQVGAVGHLLRTGIFTRTLQNYFFWTWKVGNTTATGKVGSPLWSYRLAIEGGWAPTDPREAEGYCDTIGSPYDRFTGPPKGWQVGSANQGDVPTIGNYVWPPREIGGFKGAEIAALPRYNPIGPIPTPPVPEFKDPDTAKPIDMGDGWFDDTDAELMSVPDPSCAYPDPWKANNVAVPDCAGIPAIEATTTRKRDLIAAIPRPIARRLE